MMCILAIQTVQMIQHLSDKNTAMSPPIQPIQPLQSVTKTIIQETPNKEIHKHIDIHPTVKIIETPMPPRIDPVKLYDYKKLYDPLEDPTKRVDRYLLGPLEMKRMFNYPTHGYPDNYRWIGLLISEDTSDEKNKILRLFGRQKFPRSNEYQYYTMINMGHDQIKVHLHHYCRELYDHDDVTIKELGKKYTVQLNKDDDLTYNPYF